MRGFSSRPKRQKTSMPSGGLLQNITRRRPTEWKRKSSLLVGALAKHPLMGTKRQDITPLDVRFWTLPKFPNYVIVYRPEPVPLQVVAVLHGKRDLKEVLKRRS
jgi:plasmid stabilization system protein ParE